MRLRIMKIGGRRRRRDGRRMEKEGINISLKYRVGVNIWLRIIVEVLLRSLTGKIKMIEYKKVLQI